MGKGKIYNKRTVGFTLVELLVVVLIIGILTAVAVPQYQKAVEKSKAVQALVLLKTAFTAYEAYYLDNGTYPTSFDQLDIDIPWTGNAPFLDLYYNPCKSNEDWAIQLLQHGSDRGILIGRISGPYAGAAFGFFYYTSTDDVPLQQILCIESRQNVIKPFTKQKGDYCQKIFKGAGTADSHIDKYFTLP